MRRTIIVCDRCGLEDELHPYRLMLSADYPLVGDYSEYNLSVDLCGSCAESVRQLVGQKPSRYVGDSPDRA